MEFPLKAHDGESKWMHDRDHVRLLHNAHADYMEAEFRHLQSLGSSDGIVIRQVGPVRTFISCSNSFYSRAIFSGDETREQVEAVFCHYDNHRATCLIEVNIANSYVDPPHNWEPRLLRRLLAHGCVAGGFRCVWCRDQPLYAWEREAGNALLIRRFLAEESRDYAAVMSDYYQEQWTEEQCTRKMWPGLFQYVGFDDKRPVAFGSLFLNGRIGYLANWETQREYRRRGFQRAGIYRRIADAFDMGCDLVFTVSDIDFASPRNLQRCGLRLAYNYLVVLRQPVSA